MPRVIGEFVKISNTRTLLRCFYCNGIIATLDDIPKRSAERQDELSENEKEKLK